MQPLQPARLDDEPLPVRCNPCLSGLTQVWANECERARTPARLAMQKVVGSSSFIRSKKFCKCAEFVVCAVNNPL
jgi:hypothetical protein